MAFFSVLIPPPRSGGAREQIEQAQLLPDRFTWSAFIFTGLWLLSKRLWLATLLFAALWGAVTYGGAKLGLASASVALMQLAMGLFIGLEGQNLVARKLQRRGWRLTDVVEAPNLSSAERRYFERALAGLPLPPAPRGPDSIITQPQPLTSQPVIGLFPEAKGR